MNRHAALHGEPANAAGISHAADRDAPTCSELLRTSMAASSQFLLGTTDEIIDSLLARREQYGISYFTIMSHNMETLAPIVAQLADR